MKANIVKVLVTLAVTVTALPVFIIQGKVRWWPAIILTIGLSLGGWVGARIAVKGGERVIRIFMIVAAIGLTGKLLGVYGLCGNAIGLLTAHVGESDHVYRCCSSWIMQS